MILLILAALNVYFIKNEILKIIVGLAIVVATELKRKNGNSTSLEIVAEFISILTMIINLILITLVFIGK